MEDAGCKTTHFDWKIFERRRRSETPDATHGDTEEGAQGKELTKGIHKTGAKLETGAQQQIDDQGPFPTEAIRQDTKDDLQG